MAFPPDKKKPADKKPAGPPKAKAPGEEMPAEGMQPPMPSGPVPPEMQGGAVQPPNPGEGMDPYEAMMGLGQPGPPFAGMGMQGGGMLPPSFGPATGAGEPDMDEDAYITSMLGGGGFAQPPGQGVGQGMGMGGGMPPMGGMAGPMPMQPGMPDPYCTLPGEPDHALDGIGPEDPKMGLTELLNMLMLAHAGVGGGARTSSGLVPDPPTNTMMGLGQVGQQWSQY